VHPGRDEVAVLKEFENACDGVVMNATDPPGDALLDTRSFVRPQWTDGRLTLFTCRRPTGTSRRSRCPTRRPAAPTTKSRRNPGDRLVNHS
jgi:hypothetical protein